MPQPHGPATEEYTSAERYSSAGGPQGFISLEYQICPSRPTIWYSSNWIGPDKIEFWSWKTYCERLSQADFDGQDPGLVIKTLRTQHLIDQADIIFQETVARV